MYTDFGDLLVDVRIAFNSNNLEKAEGLIAEYLTHITERKHFPIINLLLFQQTYHDILELFLKYIDINCKSTIGETLLQQCCVRINDSRNFPNSNQYYEYISFILRHTKNINSMSHYGSSALIVLIDSLYDENVNEQTKNIILEVLELHADIFIYNNEGMSAVWKCISLGQYDILKLLLENAYVDGIKRNIKINMSTFRWAVDQYDTEEIYERYDIIELLLPYVEDINELIEGKTILQHYYEGHSFQNVIELLTENGAL